MEGCSSFCASSHRRCLLIMALPPFRLPCNMRCERLLDGCGHRCPGLCGEDCRFLAPFCVHKDCMANAPDRITNQVCLRNVSVPVMPLQPARPLLFCTVWIVTVWLHRLADSLPYLTQCVDQIMLTTFSELQSEELDADPLVALACGHAFKVSNST